jgi:hypothetical protein
MENDEVTDGKFRLADFARAASALLTDDQRAELARLHGLLAEDECRAHCEGLPCCIDEIVDAPPAG